MRLLGLLPFIWATSVYAGESRLETLANGVQVIHADGQTYYTGLKQKPATYRGLGETHVVLNDCGNLPDEFDLRDFGTVPSIKDQGQCGSCWAFSQTQSLESSVAASGGKLQNLSEEELVSCDGAQQGCGGGLLNGFDYQIAHGQSLASAFPYVGFALPCVGGLRPAPAAQGTSYVMVGTSDHRATEQQVQCAIYKSHTIPWVVVGASSAWGKPPVGDNDVYAACQNGQPNHAVGIVGWKKVDGKIQFKMRNSWGSSWGGTAGRPGSEKGYMMMPLGCDNLGYEVAYIQTTAQGCMAPTPKLPAEITITSGSDAKLSVAAETGVDYTWQQGKNDIGVGDSTLVSPTVDTVYTVTAKNACGTATSMVRVKVL